MILRRSRFIHQLPVGDGRILIIHAISALRVPADRDVDRLLNYFEEPREVPSECEALTALIPYSLEAIEQAIKGLIDRQILTDKTPEEELESASHILAPTHGRDPAELLERYRRENQEGAQSYWSVGSSYGMKDLATSAKRVDILLFGDCDIQMEADFLRREAASRNIDLHVAATFPDDVRFASEHKHNAIFIGALRARHTIPEQPAAGHSPHATYIAQAHLLLKGLRERSDAPLLIDNLPEPTVQPNGFAERGLDGHRTRFRMANITLAELAATLPGVYIVDVAAALTAIGSEDILDDGLVGFTHFGSSGWMLQRPEYEKAAVHNIFPDLAPLAAPLEGDPFKREKKLAATHIDALVTTLGIDRKKCVILDLDGTLWPGVLAETGSPFAWSAEISGAFSYIGLYFGLHEALLCLKARGIILACVSKNDEATVRELWKYPDNYPHHRLLKPDDFVTWRVNWNDKVDNIRSIAEELGFALDSFLFIDDHPVERDRVRQRLPEVEVWGENPFRLRRDLLNDPRLQFPIITNEASARSNLVKAQLGRQQLHTEIINEDSYIASLDIKCQIELVKLASSRLERVEELFQRTTQFNTTGRKFSSTELSSLLVNPLAKLFVINVSDRFGDHGLVGAAVIINDEILGLAMSCRILGMGVEHQFVQHILNDLKSDSGRICGRIMETARNVPVRNIFKDNGFTEIESGLWQIKF